MSPRGDSEPSSGDHWIFGYGSLVWRPAFAHQERRPAFVNGFARRFWQGSTDHRGVQSRPGRVVTLVRDDDPALLAAEPDHRPSPCWGVAYRIPADDPEGVLEGLDEREREGYERLSVDLFLSMNPSSARARAVRGTVYVAGPRNASYLGPASLDAIAAQVGRAVGPSGPNPDYVFQLARSLRELGAVDPHVFEVESVLASQMGRGEG